MTTLVPADASVGPGSLRVVGDRHALLVQRTGFRLDEA